MASAAWAPPPGARWCQLEVRAGEPSGQEGQPCVFSGPVSGFWPLTSPPRCACGLAQGLLEPLCSDWPLRGSGIQEASPAAARRAGGVWEPNF